MHRTATALAFALVVTSSAALAQQGASGDPRRFDGRWDVNINCAQTRDAQGYAVRIAAQIANGEMTGETGTQGDGSSHRISGRIAPDGSASLRVSGITGAAKYNSGGAAAGTRYGYTAIGKLEGKSGSAERVELRPCSLFFTRR